ncbi:14420_t:CDS:1, partial [Dentiscutata erythropus]
EAGTARYYLAKIAIVGKMALCLRHQSKGQGSSSSGTRNIGQIQ